METTEIQNTLTSVLPKESISMEMDAISLNRVSNPLVESGETPSHIVHPQNCEQIQGLVRLANEHELNLTVSSSKGMHLKGGFSAGSAAVHMDLSSMKKILWINRRNRVCMIEPGVTYGELITALESHGMTVPMPLAPRNGKSIVAAIMDREPSTWPNKQWDMSDPVGSTEFIFGNGELFRTGAAGGPGTIEQQRAAGGAQKCSLGPSQTDFHRVVQGAQGSMGIVTWITLRTELKPSIEKTYLIGTDNIEKLLPFMYEVQRPWLGEHAFILDHTALALLMSSKHNDSFESISDSLPKYTLLQNIAGFTRLPEERLAYQDKDIKEIAQRHNLLMKTSIGSVTGKNLLATATSPCGETDFRHAYKGHCVSIFFLTTLDRVSIYQKIISDLANKYGLNENAFGSYIQPMVQNHCCHMEFMVPFDPDNSEEIENMRKFEKEAVKKLISEKAFFSRPYGTAQDLVFDQNPMNTDILKKVKNIFDPKRVLNRGKWDL